MKHLPFDWVQRIQLVFNPYKLHRRYERKMQKVIENFNPDMIHAHFGYNGIKFLPLAKKLKIPMLITFWGSDASKRLKDRQYIALLNEHFHYLKSLCCSNELKVNLGRCGLDTKDIQVHYAGVNVDKFPMTNRKCIVDKLANEEKVIFLQVSRFVGKKGHQITVRAFKDFLERSENSHLFELRFIGEGPLLNDIGDLVKELGLSKQIKFLGVKSSDEVTQEMIASDVLLQHSVVARDGDMEGLPIVIMEAMATGLIVVSTYHSGIPELIENGVNGFLVEEGDHLAYVKCLQNLLHFDSSNMRGLARKKILEDFNLSIQNRKLNTVYENLLSV